MPQVAGAVVDANIVFSALRSRESHIRDILFGAEPGSFHCPKFIFVELFKHKERIQHRSGLSEDELLEVLRSVPHRLDFVDEDAVSVGIWMEARRLCEGVDLKDAGYVALSLHLGCPLWTRDAELMAGLRVRGSTNSTYHEPLG